MKKWLAYFMIIMISFLTVACNQSTQVNNADTDTNNTSELTGTITIWSWDVAAKSLEETANNFKVLHPKVEFIIEDLGTDQVYDKLTTGLASGVGLPDIVSIEGDRVAGFASKFPNGFVDFSSIVNQQEFLKSKISECTVNGKLIALPWDAAPCGLYYRTDYFEQANINPESIITWDDLIVAGKKLNDMGIKMLPAAISRRSTLYEFILTQQNASLFDASGKTNFTSDASIKAMTLIKKMVDEGIVYDNVNWDGLVTATQSGKIATVPSAVWWAGTMKDEITDGHGKWAVMRLPAVEKGGITAVSYGGSNVMVPSSSKNLDAAIAFAQFAMTDYDSIINGFSNYGLYPSYISVYADALFNAEEPYFNNQKIWDLFAEIGKEIPAQYHSENRLEITDMLVNTQANILLSNAPILESLQELQKNIDDKFSK